MLARAGPALCARFRIFKQRPHGGRQLGGISLGPAQSRVQRQRLAFRARRV